MTEPAAGAVAAADAIATKDIVGWIITGVGLLFVFLYSKSRADRTARQALIEKFRDLVIETEGGAIASLSLPGNDPSQMERYIAINCKFKRLQGYAVSLKAYRAGDDLVSHLREFKRIATGSDAQSTSRLAAGPGEGRPIALSGAAQKIVDALDSCATRFSIWG